MFIVTVRVKSYWQDPIGCHLLHVTVGWHCQSFGGKCKGKSNDKCCNGGWVNASTQPTAAWMSNIHRIKHIIELLLFLSLVGLDNSGLDEQISENPPNSWSPSHWYASCRVLLSLMCEITEGSGEHTYQHTSSSELALLPHIDGFWRMEMRNCSLFSLSVSLTFSSLFVSHSLLFVLDSHLEKPFGSQKTAKSKKTPTIFSSFSSAKEFR